MNMPDPVVGSAEAFAELGLPADASAAEIGIARRRLAREHHPDLGGDSTRMTAVNEAAATALRSVEKRSSTPSDEHRRDPSASKQNEDRAGQTSDVASFTEEALPAEAFEGLLIAAASMGELIDEDPPYRLEVHLYEPIRCWCRLEVVPDAGASTVSLTVGPIEDPRGGADPPDVDEVRDVWVEMLNQLDWS